MVALSHCIGNKQQKWKHAASVRVSEGKRCVSLPLARGARFIIAQHTIAARHLDNNYCDSQLAQ